MRIERKRVTKRYLNSFDALYGDGKVEEIKKPSAKVKRKCPREAHEQIVAVARIKKLGIKVHHSPNGGKREIAEASKLKLMGVSAGFPDLIIPYARKGFHMLLIEAKPLSGGTLSESQKEWGKHFLSEGYSWHEAKGADEIMKIVYDYFGITANG